MTHAGNRNRALRSRLDGRLHVDEHLDRRLAGKMPRASVTLDRNSEATPVSFVAITSWTEITSPSVTPRTTPKETMSRENRDKEPWKAVP